MTGRVILAVLLAFLAWNGASPAAAQDARGPAVADQADVEFRLGNDAYVAGDFQRALGHYFASHRLVANHNVLFNVAKCYENLDQFVESHRYYSLYLGGVSGDDRKEVERALARIAKRVGTVQIESNPTGAAVYLDRKNLGEYARTPARVVVKPGTYDIIVEREGWVPQILQDVTVAAGGEVKRTVQLAAREGNVRLSGSPRQVTLQVLPDGPEQSTAGDASVVLPVGRLKVRLSAPGFRAHVRDVDVSPSGTTVIEYELLAEEGSLTIRATEPGAAVYVDGELLGFAPVVLSVPLGVREVVVRAVGFQPYIEKVEVSPGATTEIDAALAGADEVAAASRAAESVRDAPASVSLIGAREIASFGYTGTADALQGTRGIFFTNDLTYHTAGMRGYGPFSQFGNRTLVLVDGHPFNDSWIEASFHELELSADLYSYDRVELVRGPTSVLYGSGAFQGVVSLVSPDLKDEFQPLQVGMSATDDGVYRAYGHSRYAFEDGGVQASVAVVQGQPREFVSPARAAAGEPAIATGVGGVQVYTGRVNAAWRDFTLYSMLHDRDKQSPAGAYETLFGDTRSHERDTRAFADLRHRLRMGDGAALENRVFLDTYDFHGEFAYLRAEGGVSTDRFSGIWSGLESRLELTPFSKAESVTSFELTRHVRHRTRSENEDGPTVAVDAPFWKTALSTTLRYDFNSSIGARAGIRYDLWAFDSLAAADGTEEPALIQNVNPTVAVIVHPVPAGTLKVIGSRGFRAPSVYELSYNDGGVTQIANPELTPESIWSAELEYSHELWSRFEGLVAVYTQQLRNRIETLGGGIAADPLQFQNVAEPLWGGGLDFELRRAFYRGWMASAVYSFQRTRPGPFATLFESGDNVPNSPRSAGAMKLVVPLIARSLALANRVTFESSRIDRLGGRTQPVAKWDLVFSGEASAIPVRWSFGVRNLLDWEIAHPVGDEFQDAQLRQPGRTFVADIALTY